MKRKIFQYESIKAILVTIAVLLYDRAKESLQNGDYFTALVCGLGGTICVLIVFYLNASLFYGMVKKHATRD